MLPPRFAHYAFNSSKIEYENLFAINSSQRQTNSQTPSASTQNKFNIPKAQVAIFFFLLGGNPDRDLRFPLLTRTTLHLLTYYKV